MAHHLAHHRGDIPPVETVKDASRLLGVNKAAVDLAGVLKRCLDGRRGDLVEHHPAHRHVRWRVQHLEQVPRNGLSLAVLISGEIQLVGLLEQLAQLRHL